MLADMVYEGVPATFLPGIISAKERNLLAEFIGFLMTAHARVLFVFFAMAIRAKRLTILQ
ncbi:MAG: hypothetical protein APF80_04790 [Alphaproteobacteria bacterium BRH_c36]|nr:MAG: hypothetical protein APF80_04790 [Alphaproteobacteria bacterium BRH_c36]